MSDPTVPTRAQEATLNARPSDPRLREAQRLHHEERALQREADQANQARYEAWEKSQDLAAQVFDKQHSAEMLTRALEEDRKNLATARAELTAKEQEAAAAPDAARAADLREEAAHLRADVGAYERHVASRQTALTNAEKDAATLHQQQEQASAESSRLGAEVTRLRGLAEARESAAEALEAQRASEPARSDVPAIELDVDQVRTALREGHGVTISDDGHVRVSPETGQPMSDEALAFLETKLPELRHRMGEGWNFKVTPDGAIGGNGPWRSHYSATPDGKPSEQALAEARARIAQGDDVSIGPDGTIVTSEPASPVTVDQARANLTTFNQEVTSGQLSERLAAGQGYDLNPDGSGGYSAVAPMIPEVSANGATAAAPSASAEAVGSDASSRDDTQAADTLHAKATAAAAESQRLEQAADAKQDELVTRTYPSEADKQQAHREYEQLRAQSKDALHEYERLDKAAAILDERSSIRTDAARLRTERDELRKEADELSAKASETAGRFQDTSERQAEAFRRSEAAEARAEAIKGERRISEREAGELQTQIAKANQDGNTVLSKQLSDELAWRRERMTELDTDIATATGEAAEAKTESDSLYREARQLQAESRDLATQVTQKANQSVERDAQAKQLDDRASTLAPDPEVLREAGLPPDATATPPEQAPSGPAPAENDASDPAGPTSAQQPAGDDQPAPTSPEVKALEDRAEALRADLAEAREHRDAVRGPYSNAERAAKLAELGEKSATEEAQEYQTQAKAERDKATDLSRKADDADKTGDPHTAQELREDASRATAAANGLDAAARNSSAAVETYRIERIKQAAEAERLHKSYRDANTKIGDAERAIDGLENKAGLLRQADSVKTAADGLERNAQLARGRGDEGGAQGLEATARAMRTQADAMQRVADTVPIDEAALKNLEELTRPTVDQTDPMPPEEPAPPPDRTTATTTTPAADLAPDPDDLDRATLDGATPDSATPDGATPDGATRDSTQTAGADTSTNSVGLDDGWHDPDTAAAAESAATLAAGPASDPGLILDPGLDDTFDGAAELEPATTMADLTLTTTIDDPGAESFVPPEQNEALEDTPSTAPDPDWVDVQATDAEPDASPEASADQFA